MTERDKRKATGPPPNSDTPRSSKRIRLPNLPDETPQGTTEIGFQFLESIRNSKDKHGRPIATEFLTLPNKNNTAYYKQIRLPIAISTIEEKLKKKQYPNLSALEGDIKRMVQNAKQYNTRGSAVFEDAERIRKTASNWMVKHNPAYKIPGYQAVPTPIPDEDEQPDRGTGDSNNKTATPGAEKSHSRRSSRMFKKADSEPEEDAQPQAEPDEEEPSNEVAGGEAEAEAENEQEVTGDGSERFKGLSFQDAQNTIIEELIEYRVEDLQIYLPFVTLPPRSLTDYYQVIRHPVSLKAVQKKIKGHNGRAAPHGPTEFHTWDQFEREVGFIWINCRTYNEDGTEIFALAAEFEAHFLEILNEAKAVVDAPARQSIKLRLNEPKLKIKLGVHRDSPGSTPGPSTPGVDKATPGVIVDNDALARQQRLVSAGMNGLRSKPNGTKNPISSSATPVPTLPHPESRSGSAASPPRQVNGVKMDGALASIVNSTLRPDSGSPHPQGQPGLLPSLYPTSHNSIHHTQAYSDGPPSGLVESKLRPAKQGISDYLLPSTQLVSHAALNGASPFKARIPASKTSLHQNVTFQLSGAHDYLQVIPYIPVGLSNRPYRLFVTVNGHKLSGSTTQTTDRSRPVFEAKLQRGIVNKLEVEVLAGKADASIGEKDEVEWEKLTCFIHCLRS